MYRILTPWPHSRLPFNLKIISTNWSYSNKLLRLENLKVNYFSLARSQIIYFLKNNFNNFGNNIYFWYGAVPTILIIYLSAVTKFRMWIFSAYVVHFECMSVTPVLRFLSAAVGVAIRIVFAASQCCSGKKEYTDSRSVDGFVKHFALTFTLRPNNISQYNLVTIYLVLRQAPKF